MLTDQDIKKLTDAQRGVFATKDDFAELKAAFSDLQASVDRYLKFTEAWLKSWSSSKAVRIV